MKKALREFPALPSTPQEVETRVAELEAAFTQLERQPNSAEVEKFLLQRRFSLEHFVMMLELLKKKLTKNLELRAAIELKNLVAENWKHFVDEGSANQALDHIRLTVLLLFLHNKFADHRTLRFIKEALVLIARNDFPMSWPSLIDILSESLSDEQHEINFRCFQILSKLSRKYEEQSRSDPLYEEIIRVIDVFHDHLLYFSQGYITALKMGGIEPLLALKILRNCLKIFYRFVFQDIHPKIEDNISNWAQLIRQILSPEFATNFNAPEEKKLAFECRGEATKLSMFVSTKYKQDFQEYIRDFVETIWQNCTRFSMGGDEETLVTSIRFFKTFASNEEFHAFFGENLPKIVQRLLLPALIPGESEQQMFEDELEAFVETIFSPPQPSVKRRHAVSELASTLTRFHRPQFIKVLTEALAELKQNRSLNSLQNELAFLDLFCMSVVLACSTENGATQIIAPESLVKDIWQSLCETFWADYLNSVTKASQREAAIASFAICFHCRYAAVFRNFLDPIRLFRAAAAILSTGKPCPPLKFCMIRLMQKIVKMNKFTIHNNLQADDSKLSFFQKYYNSPKKITVNFDKESRLLSFSEQEQVIKEVLKLLVQQTIQDKLEAQVTRLVLEIAKLSQSQISSIEVPLLQFIGTWFNQLTQGKVPLHGDILSPLFDLTVLLLPRSAEVLDVLATGIAASPPELSGLIFQLSIMLLRKSKSSVNLEFMRTLLAASLDVKRYNHENFGALFSYILFAVEYMIAKKDPSLWPAISLVIEQMRGLRLIRPIFEALELMIVREFLVNEAFLSSVSIASEFCYPASSGSVDATFISGICLRQFVFLFCLTVHKIQFAQVINILSTHKALPAFCKLVCSQAFGASLASLGGQRSFQVLLLAQVLFEGFSLFERNSMKEEFAALLHAVLENIWNRKFNIKAIAGRSDELREREGLDQVSNFAYSNVYRLADMKNEGKAMTEAFVEATGIVAAQVDHFFLQKTLEFAHSQKAPLESIVGNKKFVELIHANKK